MEIYDELVRERGEVAGFMRRLYHKGLTTSSGGNISLRCRDGLVLVTPSGLDKGELSADQVSLIRLDGENLAPRLTPTMEAGMHLEILRRRPEIKAVVHAHPVFATAFACLDLELDTGLCSESYMLMPRLANVGFAVPGSPELARLAAESLSSADVALLSNHGVIAVGDSLFKAFELMETAETAAKINFLVRSLGGGRPLGDTERRLIGLAFAPDGSQAH